MTVLISGAGIAGLTLALSLRDQGIPFRILEKVGEIKPLGVGINIQPHAMRELTEMGMADAVVSFSILTSRVGYYNKFGQRIHDEPRGRAAGYNWPQCSVHRGHLQLFLLSELFRRSGPDTVRLGHSIQGYRATRKGVVAFGTSKDGGKFEAEGAVLVAADGIHSALRAANYPDEGAPVWGGTIMWRGTTRSEAFLDGSTMAMIGTRDRKFVTYPIGTFDDGTQLINWIADLRKPADYLWTREDWTRKGTPADFAPSFADWQFDWIDVPGLIEKAQAIYEYPMVDRDPVDQWTFKGLTLMGDAAHAMYPIGSNGASQAILDARVLTQAFREYGVGQAALIEYERARLETVNMVVLANRGDGPDKVLDRVDDLAPNGFEKIEDVLSLKDLDTITSGYKKTAGFDIEALNARAPIVK